MILTIKNIGIIKQSTININGLSVIAGENDSGKSTIGKVLMALIKADNTSRQKVKNKQSTNFNANRKESFNRQIELLFDGVISRENDLNSCIKLTSQGKTIYNIEIKNNKCIKFDGLNENDKRDFLDCTYLQTPLVWDLYDFFVSIATMRTENDIYGFQGNIQYPYILWDLYGKLAKKRFDCRRKSGLIEDIRKIIKGEFSKEKGIYYFAKNADGEELKVPLKNIATGIKSFGIIQILLDNCYMTPYGLFIFDEPEIHLHPKWQLKFAHLITKLVKNNIKIVVNSHSPYMIEALKRYSDIEKIEKKIDFYLAEDGNIEQIVNSNAKTLSEIFAKLSQPFDEFEKMESSDLEQLING